MKQPSSSGTGKDGISWPEILFLLSILLIVVSVGIPSWFEIRNRQHSKRAYSAMRVFIEAARRFNLEYRRWPIYQAPQRGDAVYGIQIPNAGVMNILRALDDTGNEAHHANPSQIDFFDVVNESREEVQFDAQGTFLDPWGHPYQVILDANYDNICAIPGSERGPVFGDGVLIWSMGPDGRSGTRDDLKSW